MRGVEPEPRLVERRGWRLRVRRAPPPRAIIRARYGRGRRRDGRDGEQGGDGGEDRQQRAEEADPSAGEGERPVNLPHLSPLPLGSSWSLPDDRGRGVPGLGLPAVKVSPSPHSGSGRGGRSCPAGLPLPPTGLHLRRSSAEEWRPTLWFASRTRGPLSSYPGVQGSEAGR